MIALSRARALALGLATALVLGVIVVILGVAQGHGSTCGRDESTVAAGDVPGVFGRVSPSDARLTRLATAAAGWHLGKVAGGVGFDYGQWLSVGATRQGLLTWTKRDPVVGFVEDDLSARWGLRQAPVKHAWDASGTRFFQLELSAKHPLWISSYRLADGRRLWCAPVGRTPTTADDPYGTAVLGDGDLLAVADDPGPAVIITRLSARDGGAEWSRSLSGVDRADFVGDLGQGLALVGGRPAYDVDDAQVPQPAGPALEALDEATGRIRWSYRGRQVHVVGYVDGRIVLRQDSSAGAELVALDRTGAVAWHRSAVGLGDDFATAGSTILADTGHSFVGLDPATGAVRWTRPFPARPQYLPYGFVLAAQPMLDASHVLIGGTGGLHSLDLGTGAVTTYALPADGINTTYWPYQVVVTPRQIVVVTNIGAVVLNRS